MNIDTIKKQIEINLGKTVRITVYGIRNKVNHFEGKLYKIYPNIFTIIYNGGEKSFSYRDVITKDIYIKYL